MSPDERNIALLLAYDGRPFHGWQRLRGERTVQGEVEAALSDLLGGERTVEGSGRTDRGVHADGQVATTRIPADVDVEGLAMDLHERLQPHVTLRAVREAPGDLHARMSALGKTYRYEIVQGGELPAELEMKVWHVKRSLRVAPMAEAAQHLVGTHDFTSFATPGKGQRQDAVRTIADAHVEAEGPHLAIWLSADGFLYKMVRTIVRALARVGEGKAAPDDIARILAARDRSASPGAAPASGLYLEEVHYDPPLFVAGAE